MEPALKHHNSDYVIISIKRPFLWSRTSDEIWMLNPPRRYIVNAECISKIEAYVETVSDLKTSAHYRPLDAKVNLVKSKILVERTRDRGIGDMLFLTGVFSYLQTLASFDTKIYTYSLVDRGQVLMHNPAIFGGTALSGPVEYNDLHDFNYHWFVDSVTEHDEEPDQLNVYDALYKTIGIDPARVQPQFKRPYVHLSKEDLVNMDSMYFYIHQDRRIDLRHTPYYVVAPLANASLRTAPYRLWLDTIKELAKQRPVLVVGRINEGRMPHSDISFPAFFKELAAIESPNVINLMGDTPLRMVMSLISRSISLVSLDSGLLYVAQGLRVPAVSLWGSHHPHVRIGYDPDYMKLAVYPQRACPSSPCFAYRDFPESKCPLGTAQSICEVYKAITVNDILEKIQIVEKNFTDSTQGSNPK